MSSERGGSMAGEEGSAFLPLFWMLGGVSAVKNLKAQKKILHKGGELLTALFFFFLFLHLLPSAVAFVSYWSVIEESLFPSLLANLPKHLLCLLCFLVVVLISPLQYTHHFVFTFTSVLLPFSHCQASLT